MLLCSCICTCACVHVCVRRCMFLFIDLHLYMLMQRGSLLLCLCLGKCECMRLFQCKCVFCIGRVQLLQPGPPPPRWRDSGIKIIFKRGRHITSDPSVRNPILHKLFRRLHVTLDASQFVDQAGFRPGYSTTERVYTLHQFRQRASDWHQPRWVAATDFKKRRWIQLNTVAHGALCENEALRSFTYRCSQSFTNSEQQCRHVKCKHFHVKRGDQARPAQHAFCSTSPTHMKPPSEKWKREKRGVRLAEHDSDLNFSNLRFCRRPHSRRLAHLIATRPPC